MLVEFKLGSSDVRWPVNHHYGVSYVFTLKIETTYNRYF